MKHVDNRNTVKYCNNLLDLIDIYLPKIENKKHFLSKCTLACKDIFLFNHPCSTTESVAYDLLESIKDGRILSHKYNTAALVFNIPNTVIVFSYQIQIL